MAKKLLLICIFFSAAQFILAQRISESFAQKVVGSADFEKAMGLITDDLTGVFGDDTTSFLYMRVDWKKVTGKVSKELQGGGVNWHRGEKTQFAAYLTIDSIVFTDHEAIVDSASHDSLHKRMEQGDQLLCMRGHFAFIEDTASAYSGVMNGIVQIYFLYNTGINKCIPMYGINLLEPKKVYAGFWKSSKSEQWPLQNWYVSDLQAAKSKDNHWVLPDLRPIGVWNFVQDQLLFLPSSILKAPKDWWTFSPGTSIKK